MTQFSPERRKFLQAAVFGMLSTAVPAPVVTALAQSSSSTPTPNPFEVIEGVLADRSGDQIELNVANTIRRLHLSTSSFIWRGGLVEASALCRGDDVLVRIKDNQIAYAWANLDRVRGTVLRHVKTGYLLQVHDRSQHKEVER